MTEAQKFIRERLHEEKKTFWHKVDLLQLKLFSSEDKETTITRTNESKATMKAEQNLFTKLLVVSQTRKINLQAILKYELSAVPLSLFFPDGTRRTTGKSKLLAELEFEGSSVPTLPILPKSDEKAVTIIDFMAIVQKVVIAKPKFIHEVQTHIESHIRTAFKESDIVAMVPDRYDIQMSIKEGERSRRGSSRNQPEYNITSSKQALAVEFGTFLSNPKNKINLVNYLFQSWKTSPPLSGDQELYLANLDGSITHVTSETWFELDWSTDHEEADTKMFVIAHYLANKYELSRLIIVTPDTDVVVIACYQFVEQLHSLKELWLKTGTKKKKDLRYISINKICEKLGDSLTKLLPVLHSITGCDSVSSFADIGKKTAFNHLKSNAEEFETLQSFGNSPELDVDGSFIEPVFKFICTLYNKDFTSGDINTLRFQLFSKKGQVGEKLPPTLDSLLLHLRRANYQCYIWKSACTPILSLPSPVGNGWAEDNNGFLTPEYMIFDSAPSSVLELISCKCKKGCKNNLCSCRKANFNCCGLCKDCTNDDTEELSVDSDDDGDE